MAGITLAKAIDYFIRENDCNDREEVLDRITEGLDYLLNNGGGKILWEWKIPVHKGKFTLPKNLETPVKYKVSKTANSGFGIFHSSYLSYSTQGIRNTAGYADWNPEFEQQANTVPTQYRPPMCGVRLCFTTRNDSDVGVLNMVAGKQRGMPIAAMHNGKRTAGEQLKTYHVDDPKKKYSSFVFDEITDVVLNTACDYRMLSGVDATGRHYFLSHYHPDEVVPQYKEVVLYAGPAMCQDAEGCDFMLHILGRIDPTIRYTLDQDILPISSPEILKLLAKRAKYEGTNDFENVGLMEGRIQNLVKKQVMYQSPPGKTTSVNLAAGAGSMTNL